MTADAAASYQTLRGHLAYLKLTRAEELLASHLEAARAQQLSHVAFLEGLLAEEVAATKDRRHRARLRFAHFPVTKHLADFDFDFQPSVDRRLVAELATLAFLDAGTHALFMGPPGVGKTHLAIGLGHEVVAAGYRVYYTTAAHLVDVGMSTLSGPTSLARSGPTPRVVCEQPLGRHGDGEWPTRVGQVR